MKIAFLFMVRSEIKNSKIWEEYFKKSDFKYNISIYCDPGYELKYDFFKKFQVYHNIFKNREMNVEVKYDFLNKNINDCDYFIFLTEDTLPIKKINDLYVFLNNIIDKSIFGYELDPHVNMNDGRNKYGSVRIFDFPEELRYKNNDWLCLSKKHAKLLVEKKDDCYSFMHPLGGEHFVSSILNKNNELDNIIAKNFVIENWDGYNGKYPSTFSNKDFEKIKNIMENNEMSFFLRKFDDEFSNLNLYFELINLGENKEIVTSPKIIEDSKKNIQIKGTKFVRGIYKKNSGKN